MMGDQAPSIFTLVEERWELKLQSQKVPATVLVVDHGALRRTEAVHAIFALFLATQVIPNPAPQSAISGSVRSNDDVAAEHVRTIEVKDSDVTANLIYNSVPKYVLLRGRVMVEGEAMLPSGLRIMLQNKGPLAVSTDGKFRTSVAEGVYYVSVPELPAGFSIKSISAGSRSSWNEEKDHGFSFLGPFLTERVMACHSLILSCKKESRFVKSWSFPQGKRQGLPNHGPFRKERVKVSQTMILSRRKASRFAKP